MKSMGEKEIRKPKNKLFFEKTKKLNDQIRKSRT